MLHELRKQGTRLVTIRSGEEAMNEAEWNGRRGDITRRTFVGGVLLATSGLAARAQTEAPTPRRGGILKVSCYLNPSKLDPYTGNSAVDQTVMWPMFDTLVEFDQTMKPRPGLAKWHYPDPKTLVFDIFPDITFHDGTPCDAQAVKWNLERAMNFTRSVVKADLVNVASIEVTGPLTVVLHLKAPDKTIPLMLSDRPGMMSSPKAVEAAGDDYDRKPCGTGQFKFVSWADGDRVILARNENYRKKGQPYLDGITFRIMTDYAAGARAVAAGENDFMFLVPPRLYNNLKQNSDLTVYKYPSMRIMNLFFNYGRGAVKDVRVRRAINYAIDRVGFTKVTTDGTGDVACSLIPPQHWAYDAESANTFPYDPDKAKALLAEAGFGGGLTLDMMVLPDAEYRKRADIIMDNLSKAGITINLMPNQQATSTFINQQKGDMYLVSWPGRPELTQTYFQIFSKDSYYNVAHETPIANIEELINATRLSEDPAERKAAFAALTRAERNFPLFAPICAEQVVYVARNKVKGFQPSFMGKPKFDGMFLAA
jgi:ABC-type transport system substrate-binding protein